MDSLELSSPLAPHSLLEFWSECREVQNGLYDIVVLV